MADFIFRQIAKAYTKSKAAGEAKYNAYFVNTNLYAKYKDEVDSKLSDEGIR